MQAISLATSKSKNSFPVGEVSIAEKLASIAQTKELEQKQQSMGDPYDIFS